MTESNLSQFDLNFFREATNEKPGENVFVSPVSVALALAMTLNGARGDTRKAMNEVLGLPADTSPAEANERLAQLQGLFQSGRKVELTVANALFGSDRVTFKEPFLSSNRKFFDAQITALDMLGDPGGALEVINGFVSEHTKGKIPTIISSVPPEALLFLINAIYFKGAWETEFDPFHTQQRLFHLEGGQTKSHPMMSRSGDIAYFATSDFQAVRLPYSDPSVAMYIFLPAPGKTLSDFQQELTPDNWQQWLGEFQEADGHLVLPRFKLEYETSLNDMLKKLVMGIAFDDRAADFLGMCEPPPGANIVINEARHKTFVEVNEEGTEAAAATSIGMVFATSVRITPPPFDMVVDRPFFCAIRDDSANANLFLGAVRDPQ